MEQSLNSSIDLANDWLLLIVSFATCLPDKPVYIRDTWGEKKAGAETEVGCLLRAKSVYEYCGSDPYHPLTAIFRPTGAFATVEAGCFLTKSKSLRLIRKMLRKSVDAWVK